MLRMFEVALSNIMAIGVNTLRKESAFLEP